jgi:hypothetical protein
MDFIHESEIFIEKLKNFIDSQNTECEAKLIKSDNNKVAVKCLIFRIPKEGKPLLNLF